MKFAFYFFIIAQFLNFLGVFAEKITKDSPEFNPIKWEKVRENAEKPFKRIIWKSYKDDKSFFEKTNLKNKSKKNEELKEEIREVGQGSEIKDAIKAEGQSKNLGSSKKSFEEIGIGLSEKGIYFDFFKNISAKNKFGLRVNYLSEDFFTHNNIYYEGRNLNAEYLGVGMLFQRFLFSQESRSNIYFQANADISSFKLSSNIDLTKETYTYNNLQITCSACGILTIQTDPDKVHIIPTISLGYQYKNTPNFKTNLSVGMQYIDPGSLENFTNTKYNLPSYVQTRVDDWVQETQNKIDKYSEFQPSINIGFSYSF